jgi:hypothetical protein
MDSLEFDKFAASAVGGSKAVYFQQSAASDVPGGREFEGGGANTRRAGGRDLRGGGAVMLHRAHAVFSGGVRRASTGDVGGGGGGDGEDRAFDSSLEETQHLVAAAGWASAYPSIFGWGGVGAYNGTVDDDGGDDNGGRPRFSDSRVLELCISAVGDCGWAFNDTLQWHPGGSEQRWNCSGHYHRLMPPGGTDVCNVPCMCGEYVWWSMSSLLGMQPEWRTECGPEIKEHVWPEWDACQPDQFRSLDPRMAAILEDPRYRLPRRAPDGRYNPPPPSRLLARTRTRTDRGHQQRAGRGQGATATDRGQSQSHRALSRPLDLLLEEDAHAGYALELYVGSRRYHHPLATSER